MCCLEEGMCCVCKQPQKVPKENYKHKAVLTAAAAAAASAFIAAAAAAAHMMPVLPGVVDSIN